VITDPSAAPPGYTGTAGGTGSGATNTSAQVFYLYDRPCGNGVDDDDYPSEHPTHSTAQTSPSSSSYSTCQNSNHTLRPDRMWIDPPAGANPPLYKYSSDLTGGAYPGGLAMTRKGATCRANYSAADATNQNVPNKWAVHAWATKRFDEDFHVSGRATVSIHTTTVGGAAGRGLLCATLIERTESGGIASDTTIGSTTFDANWPTTARRLSFTLTVSPEVDIEQNHRLVLVLHLREESANDIAILYDHPSHQSLLEVETTTPITSGSD